MKWVNYHHLIYFREIALKGTISRASESLKVGQPSLSLQLKQLEQYFGFQLFSRVNRRLKITEEGKVILDYANQIHQLGQEMIKIAEEKVFTKDLNLPIGALDSIPKHLICDVVDLAHKKTGCYLSIYEDSISDLLRQLLGHQIEVIISDHPICSFENKKVYSKNILKRKVTAYSSPKFSHLKKGFPESLHGQPCILPTKHSKLRDDIEHFFSTKSIKPQIIAQTQDTSLQKILASKGDGIIFLPKFTTKEFVQYKKLIKIGDIDDVFAEYFLIHGKKVFENPALDLVLNQNYEKMRLGNES